MPDARYVETMKKQREGMSLEERQIVALEQIADALHDIRSSTDQIKHSLAAQNRGSAYRQ